MKVKVSEIGDGGMDTECMLDAKALNARVAGESPQAQGECYVGPQYLFEKNPICRLHLELEDHTVTMEGVVSAEFRTQCIRCAEDTRCSCETRIELTLRPLPTGANMWEFQEDLHSGYYDGREIDCLPYLEEFLLLAIPVTVYCREGCKGLCAACGANLNCQSCSCVEKASEDEGLFALDKILI